MEMTVVDPANDITGKIADAYMPGSQSAGFVRVRRVISQDALEGNTTDILVFAPDCIISRHDAPLTIRCGILLLPGDAVADDFEAGCVVTYGMSPKNSITFSSIGEETCVLALQRELLTINGDVLERQELKIRSEMKPDRLLAVAGALLLLGQKLPEINQ